MSDQASLDLLVLSAQLGDHMRAKGWRVTTAESCTGGGIAATITETAGSSAWFDAGWVTYSNAAKAAMLGVPEDVLIEHGAVSEPVVAAMSGAAQRLSGAHFSVAVSGIAGPGGGTPSKPVGTVCFGFVTPTHAYCETLQFPGSRHAVRTATIHHALSTLIALAQKEAG
ncbi:nicotinamide-nucleotide amidohydrolase family protein [Burkholderiaceae bacterium DAT-1]|nr:nicotinamide-nucleotide amidohydrolase family protein [Burkholderiaceae bacterium DAT-1]